MPRTSSTNPERSYVRQEYYAHSLPGRPLTEWEPLERHLERVALLAGQFAEAFGGLSYGQVAGLWHDLGKYSAEFQEYLRQSSDINASSELLPGRVDHSTAGAQHATGTLPNPSGRLLSYCIAGHHSGLPDAITESDSCLERRLRKRVPSTVGAPPTLLHQTTPPLPSFKWEDEPERHFQAAFFCRMVFSCLVDADFLATEEFLAPDRSAARSGGHNLRELDTVLQEFLAKKSDAADPTLVNSVRGDVLHTCIQEAALPPGLFSLTVPTGGGKTLSSLAFALRHAVTHGQRRVIYAVPFTSIIEQNAQVFRDALAPLGANVVLEHHSAIDTADPTKDTLQSRLAAENWDASVIVTTNVQLFESLFGARPGRCRKLHRIAKSVVVLDEVQTLPVQLLRPSLAALRDLATNYGCSVLLCSATQPAVQLRNGFSIGLAGVHELAPSPTTLFNTLRRTKIEMAGSLSDADLVKALVPYRQSLCIVNTRRHAARLFGMLPNEVERFHLSAGMCPDHRSEVLMEVRTRLQQDAPCVLVSTQVVEAGVDIDFPVVYRAMTGVDSIAQAAGRCNREGRRTEGRVVVFQPEDPIPTGELRQAAQTAAELVDRFDNLLAPDAVEAYFSLHYWKRQNEWDRYRVLDCFKPGGQLDFREASRRYRLIPFEQAPIIIPWGREGQALVKRVLGGEPPNRDLSRRLQRFIVSTHPRQHEALVTSGAVAVQNDVFSVLVHDQSYDRHVGLRVASGEGTWGPDELIV